MKNSILIFGFVLALSAAASFAFVKAPLAQDTDNVEEPQQWELELYGQKFTLIPSAYDNSEHEGGPAWEEVRHHIPVLLPDAFNGEYVLSRQEILDGVEGFAESYNALVRKEIDRLSVELVEKYPTFVVAGDEPGVEQYEEHDVHQDKEFKINKMSFAIGDMFRSNTWKDAVKDYNEKNEKKLTNYYFANAYTFYEFAYALQYLHGMLKVSPEMQSSE